MKFRALFSTILLVCFSCFMVSCSGSSNQEDIPDAPVVTLYGVTDGVVDLAPTMNVRFSITAQGGIGAVSFNIESPTIVPYLVSKSLPTTIDIAETNESTKDFLDRNGVINNTSVRGQKNVTVDLSTILPKIADLGDLDATHKITVTVSDLYSQWLQFDINVKQRKIPE